MAEIGVDLLQISGFHGLTELLSVTAVGGLGLGDRDVGLARSVEYEMRGSFRRWRVGERQVFEVIAPDLAVSDHLEIGNSSTDNADQMRSREFLQLPYGRRDEEVVGQVVDVLGYQMSTAFAFECDGTWIDGMQM